MDTVVRTVRADPSAVCSPVEMEGDLLLMTRSGTTRGVWMKRAIWLLIWIAVGAWASWYIYRTVLTWVPVLFIVMFVGGQCFWARRDRKSSLTDERDR